MNAPPPTYTFERVGEESPIPASNGIPYAYHYPTSTQSHGSFDAAEMYQVESNNVRSSSSDGASVSMVSVGGDARASTPTPTPQPQSPTSARSQIYSSRGSLSVADVNNITSTSPSATPRHTRRLSIQVHRSRGEGGSQSACSVPTSHPGRTTREGKHISYPLPNIPSSSIPASSAPTSVCHESANHSQQRDNEPAPTSTSAESAPFTPTEAGARPSLSIARGAESDTSVPTTSFFYKGMRLNAVNYASVYRKGAVPSRPFFSSGSRSSESIKGTFTINPLLHIPSEFLPPVLVPAAGAEGSDGGVGVGGRKNLRLEMVNGGIDVDVYLVGELPVPISSSELTLRGGRTVVLLNEDRSAAKTKLSTTNLKTTLHLEMSGDGRVKTCSLNARIHSPFFDSEIRPPFHLTAINKSSNKSSTTSLSLPHTFHGMLIITIHAGNPDGRIVLSKKLSDRAVILNESSKARWYFVGEMGNWDRDADKVEVWAVCGKVMLQWEGEGDKDGKKGKWW